ncbi:MAG: GAF domain-containing protein [Pseudomonadota bacterium]|jgi:hypothetical protein
MTAARDDDEMFAALHAALPVRLFTITVHDLPARLFRRVWTSDPGIYPVPGTKPLVEDDWSRQVIEGGRTFVANSPEGFRALFPDHAGIMALGCRSAATIPVRNEAGQVVGTVNLLHDEGWFTPGRLAQCEAVVAGQGPALAAALARAATKPRAC